MTAVSAMPRVEQRPASRSPAAQQSLRTPDIPDQTGARCISSQDLPLLPEGDAQQSIEMVLLSGGFQPTDPCRWLVPLILLLIQIQNPFVDASVNSTGQQHLLLRIKVNGRNSARKSGG